MGNHEQEMVGILHDLTQAQTAGEADAIRERIVDQGRDAIDPLLAALDHPDPAIRRAALGMLAGLVRANITEARDRAFHPVLNRLLMDEDAGVRAEAAGALWIADRGAPYRQVSEGLLTALGDDAPVVRISAAFTLARRMEQTAAEALADLVCNDPHEKVRGAAAAALAHLDYGMLQELGAPAITALLSELDQPDVPPTYAIRALGMLRAEEAVEPLLTLLRDDDRPKTRRVACQALGSIGDARAVAMLASVRDDDPDERVREAAADALDTLGDTA